VELAQQAEKLALSRGDLEAQTSMFKLVLESMGEGLIAADHEGHFLLWNDAASKLMGRGAIDLPTKQWTPHYKVFLADGITPCPPDRLPLVRALYGESVKVELMVKPPEPEPGKFIEVTARPLKDARGNLRGGVAVLHDITERKRNEADLAQQAEELRHSQQALKTQAVMLQTVLDSMVEGLVATDEHGQFILWNPAAEKIMGLGATNLPSREWSAHYGLFLPDTVTPIPSGETPLERTLRGEGGTTELFLRHAGLNQGLWLETTGSPLIDKDGVIRGGVLAFRDITRRKTDELEIRKLNEDLEDRIAKRTEQLHATNHELEAFSYSISHDLRTPLRHISGFARILVNDFGPAMAVEAREHLQSIEDAVNRMGMMVDALLKMAVLRRKALRLSHSELNPIVDEVISMLQPECQGRNVEWRIAKLPALDCDPILMAQVFQNLLGNALKYSRGRVNAMIEVDSIHQADKPPIIFVRDNGAGFNMQYAGKLFDVFQRFHTESEFEGTGVGLATVHRIIQKHGGTIWAEAELDHGATFYFALQMTEQIGATPKATAVS
jgi:PAS domain S-box-containing protein